MCGAGCVDDDILCQTLCCFNVFGGAARARSAAEKHVDLEFDYHIMQTWWQHLRIARLELNIDRETG